MSESYDAPGMSGVFASLAIPFIQQLAADSEEDVIKDWLLHRLEQLTIHSKRILPGEIEMLRAEITERIMLSALCVDEKKTLSDGFLTILNSLVRNTSLATAGTARRQF